MGAVTSNGCDLYYEEMGEGVPILLIHPAGSTASTWGSVIDELAQIGRVISYDRRGYARSGGEPVRSMSMHAADAATILENLRTPPAVVVGTSAGAAIAVDVAVRRPDLVRAVLAHEFPWRFTRHLPTATQVATLAKMGWLTLRGRASDAAETLLRSAYSYRDGGTAWDAFPEEWRRAGGKTQGRLWRTSATRSVSIRPRPISRPSRFPSCAPTVRGAPTACAASSDYSRLPFPQRVRAESKARATLLLLMHRATSCKRLPTRSDEPRRGLTWSRSP